MFCSGQIVGDYRLLELLGEGSMGTVFRARQIALGREVALKILPDSLVGDPESVQRFRREGRIHQALRHPHLVRVLDCGAEGSTPWLALELIRGETLQHRIRAQGRQVPAAILPMAVEIADALAYLHGEGVIHRDIKPANVLVTDGGEAKLADLGLARHDSSTMITGGPALVGSLPYMAPEVLQSGLTSEASDVYSFGILLLEMSLGRCPIQGDSVAELMEHVRQGPIPASPLHRRRPGDEPLLDLVERMVAREVSARPQARDILLILQKLVDLRAERVATRIIHLSEVRARRGLAPIPRPEAFRRRKTVACAGLLILASAAIGVTRELPAITPRVAAGLVSSTPGPDERGSADVTVLIRRNLHQVLGKLGEYDLQCDREAGTGEIRGLRLGILQDSFHRRYTGDRTLLEDALGRLIEAVEAGDEAQLTGPLWLDVEHAAALAAEEGARSHGMDTGQPLRASLRRLAARAARGTAADPFRTYLARSIPAFIDYFDTLSSHYLIRRAELQGELLHLLETAPRSWKDSTWGRFHEIRTRLVLADLWAIVHERYPDAVAGSAEILRQHRLDLLEVVQSCAGSSLFGPDPGHESLIRYAFHAIARALPELQRESPLLEPAVSMFEDLGGRLDPSIYLPRPRETLLDDAEFGIRELRRLAPERLSPAFVAHWKRYTKRSL